MENLSIIHDNETKQVAFNEVGSFDILKQWICDAFNFDPFLSLKLIYEDSDGDHVTVGNERDFKEALLYLHCEKQKNLTLHVDTRIPLKQRLSELSLPEFKIQQLLETVRTQLTNEMTTNKALNLLFNKLESTDTDHLIELLRKENLVDVLDETLIEFPQLRDSFFQTVESDTGSLVDLINHPDSKPFILNLIQNPELSNGLKIALLLHLRQEQTPNVVQSSTVKHEHVACDGCNQFPIIGIRYKSYTTTNFDLCETCEASGNFNQQEPFIKIKEPIISREAVHQGIVCDGCDMYPVVGPRFVSTTVENFDLCHGCELLGRWNATHGPFLKFNVPEQRKKIIVKAKKVQPRKGLCLRAQFIGHESFPDGSLVASGQYLTKRWKVKNNGPKAWPEGCGLAWVGGEDLATSSRLIPVQALKPGEEAVIDVDMRAPLTPGRISSTWRLCTADGRRFGHRCWIDIEVVAPETKEDEVSSTADTVSDESIDDVTPPCPWQNAVDVLCNMGFSDMDNLLKLLTEMDGDIERVIDRLV